MCLFTKTMDFAKFKRTLNQRIHRTPGECFALLFEFKRKSVQQTNRKKNDGGTFHGEHYFFVFLFLLSMSVCFGALVFPTIVSWP